MIMKQEIIHIGGVPEHFNMPWHLAIDQGLFRQENVTVEWKDYPGGTGAMAKDLRSGALDVAVLLTEGIVADIIKGNESSIIGGYVDSPLIWGIHVPAKSAFYNINDIAGKRYAISRMGSGSHLMAFVDARERGWNLKEEQLVIVGDLQGAREAFKENKADIFMWERFMTQPFVSNGEFRRIGERLTPWPCFVIAARKEVTETRFQALQIVLRVIYQATDYFMRNAKAVKLVAQRFNLTKEDAANWFAHTKWATQPDISPAMLSGVVETLYKLQLVDKKVETDSLYTLISL
jgi:ABC-type nitrate/sulfonate/bicarbonate transport system substrate-binding protein